MKKRLRKKLMLKEFQQLGFRFYFDFLRPDTEELEWEFLRELISYEDSNSLSIGGGPSNFYAYSASKRKSVTEEQRLALITWLERRADIVNLVVQPLTDAWYQRKVRR